MTSLPPDAPQEALGWPGGARIHADEDVVCGFGHQEVRVRFGGLLVSRSWGPRSIDVERGIGRVDILARPVVNASEWTSQGHPLRF